MANPISGSYTAGDAITFADAMVEVDVNDEADWAVINTWATEISVTGEDIPYTETYPFEGSAIVFTGTKSSVEVTVTCVYTEGTADPYHNIRTRFESGNGVAFEVRWVPADSASGNKRFTTAGGKLMACTLPQGSGSADTANQFTFVVRADSVSMGTIT